MAVETQAPVKTTIVSSSEYFRRIIIRKDFVKNLIVVHCFVAGFRYNDGEQIIDILEPGEKLQLVHEIYNPHDANAVAVYTNDFIQLGYVPRLIAPIVARRLDEKSRIRAYVKRLNKKEYHDDRIKVEMVLKIPMK